jgi:hypothetical protein
MLLGGRSTHGGDADAASSCKRGEGDRPSGERAFAALGAPSAVPGCRSNDTTCAMQSPAAEPQPHRAPV